MAESTAWPGTALPFSSTNSPQTLLESISFSWSWNLDTSRELCVPFIFRACSPLWMCVSLSNRGLCSSGQETPDESSAKRSPTKYSRCLSSESSPHHMSLRMGPTVIEGNKGMKVEAPHQTKKKEEKKKMNLLQQGRLPGPW